MGFREQGRHLAETRREHGWAEAVRTLLAGIRYRGESRKILFALSQPRPLPDAIDAARTHTFRFATPEDLRRLSQTPEYMIAPIDVDRVERGIARCMLQEDGERLVGYAWIWSNRLAYIEDGVHLNLPDDMIYNYKAYTNPDYRGFGFQALRHLNLLRLTRDEGVRRLFGFVDQFNSKSLHGVRKSGYVPVGTLRIRRRGARVCMIVDVEETFWSNKART